MADATAYAQPVIRVNQDRGDMGSVGQNRIRVFVGSSRESIEVARGIKANLEEVAEVRIWNEGLFEPGRYTLDELLRFTSTFDFAVMAWTGDDDISSRGQQATTPRDNVILEAGIFYGALGRERVFLLAPWENRPKITSDLLGLTILGYTSPSDNNYTGALGTPCRSIASIIKREGKIKRAAEHERADIIDTYPSLDAARVTIREVCKNARDIKILSNKGLVFFGTDESIVSTAEANEFAELKRLRIILIDPESRWVNRGLMALRKYESLADFKNELRSSHDIVESGMKKFANQLMLRNSGVKYHMVEPYFRVVMTERMAFVSTYAEHPSVQVRDLPVYTFINEPGSLYGSLHRHFNDLWHNQSALGRYMKDTIEPEISTGGILTIRHEGRVYVALVMRDDGSWVLPKGHKEITDVTLEEAASREVAEEVGLKTSQVAVVKRLDEYAYDETAAKFEKAKVVYLFLMRVEGSALLDLTPDPGHLEARWWPLDAPLPFMFYTYQKTLLAEVAKREFGIDVEIAGSD